MPAETDIAAIDDGGANTAAEVRTALTSVLSRGDFGVNVLAHGAVGDGVTDDRAAIQAAIDAGTDPVFLPEGTFLFDSKHPDGVKEILQLRSGLRLVGAGVGKTILKIGDSVATDAPFLWGTDVTDVEIAHLNIDGNKSRMAAGDIGANEDEGIDLKGTLTSRIWLHDLYIHDCGSEAIDLDGTPSDVIVSNVLFEDNGGCAIHGEASRLAVSNCVSINNGQERNTNGPTAAVRDQAAGFSFIGNTEDVVLTGCVSSQDVRGVVIDGTALRFGVLGCVVNDPDNVGMWLDSSLLSFVAVEGCAFRLGTEGVRFSGGTNVSIVGNSFNGQTIAAVLVDGGGDALIAGNVMDGVPRGVYITSTADRIGIVDNLVTDATQGIRIEDGTGHISGNYIDNPTNQGIDIHNAASTDWTIIGNRISGAGAGMRLFNSPTNCVILNNDIPDGLSLTGTGHTVRGNVGYLTENRGTDTIADTTSTVSVTHGLGATPTSVTVTPRANEAVWVSARDATTFTVDRAGTSGALAFDWQAEV